jgi:exodeoxyribonuclease VII large subunit
MKIKQVAKNKSLFGDDIEKVFSVSEFLGFLNEVLKPCRAIVQGEIGEKISNYPRYVFFNLLDKDGSILKCFVWREVIDNLGIDLEPGMEIKVIGYPAIRKERGELKFQVERIELIGEGLLKKQFEILKKKLTALGYFNPETKRQIPKFCTNIGLITSKHGRGAKKDFETHLGKFGFKIFFYDARVEGSLAIEEIVAAINWFNQNLTQLDALVLIRGGGSWESLQPFNSEEIVKTIRASRIPVITGIGHEDDETLADLAADLRASTPTHAAKILTENWKLACVNIFEFEKNFNSVIYKLFRNVKENINFMQKNLTNKLQDKLFIKKMHLKDLVNDLNYSFQNYFQEFIILTREFEKNLLKILTLIKNFKIKTEQYLTNLVKNQNRWYEKIKKIFKQEEEKLNLASPELKLKQGYTITFDENGKIIKELTKLKTNQIIRTKLYKGQILSRIKKIQK